MTASRERATVKVSNGALSSVRRDSAPATGTRAREHLERAREIEHLDIVEDEDADRHRDGFMLFTSPLRASSSTRPTRPT